MTDREKAIVMAYTGKCMLTGDKFQIFYKYVEDIMGRPIWTHEIGLLADEIKGKSEADFMALCAEQEPKTDVLDKIRAEIMSEIVWHIDQNQEDCAQVLTSAIEIIDKYRGEVED